MPIRPPGVDWRSPIDGNTAEGGGGIWLAGGTVTLDDGSTITHNTATGTPPLNAGGGSPRR